MRHSRFTLAFIAALFASSAAIAQSNPGLTKGQVLTAGQWNALFAGKQDTLGYTPLNQAGGVMSGRLITAAPGASTSGFNLTPGTAPAAPSDGDLWTTSGGFYVRINGVTIGPLSGATASSFAGTSPIGVTFPAGVVTYAFNFSIANTFLAQQTNQGASGTSPGWYAQLAGDTVPRVRVGLNAQDVSSIGFGPGNAVRDTFIERLGAGSLRFGTADAASPVAQTLSVQNVLAGTSNAAGGALTVSGSRGTGSGAGGSIIFQVAPAGGSGNAQNALVNALTVFGGQGGVAVGSAAADMGGGNLNVAGSIYSAGTAPTGTGAYVRATSPALVTPSLGVATATSINGNTITAGSGTLTLSTFTASLGGNLATAGALTQAGAFATTITATNTTNSTLPAGTHTLAGLDVAQTWSAGQSFADNTFALNGSGSGNLIQRAAATSGASVIRWPAGSIDFTATGGAGQYLKQSSAGAALTVAAIAGADLPTPGASSLGGVQSKDCTSGGQFVQVITTAGAVTCATPAGGGNVSNSGTPTSGQLASWISSTQIQGIAPPSFYCAGTLSGTAPAIGTIAVCKTVNAVTVDNIEAVTGAPTGASNLQFVVKDCGTSADACASPTATVGTVTTSNTANTAANGSVSTAAVAAGHYIQITLGTGSCTFCQYSVSVAMH